jgi:hypothetical protein
MPAFYYTCGATSGFPSVDGRPIAVSGAVGAAGPSRQADHGVDVVPALGSYFELTSLVSYLKVM